MEVVLAAATPFQLLSGKVIGVGGLALVQYVIVLVPSVIGDRAPGPDRVAGLRRWQRGRSIFRPGISIGLLARLRRDVRARVCALFGALRGRRLARQPHRRTSTRSSRRSRSCRSAGYLVATYSSTGLIPIDSPLVVIMSFIPFFSPYLMLARLGQGARHAARRGHRGRPADRLHPRRALGRRPPLPLGRAPVRPAPHAPDPVPSLLRGQ